MCWYNHTKKGKSLFRFKGLLCLGVAEGLRGRDTCLPTLVLRRVQVALVPGLVCTEEGSRPLSGVAPAPLPLWASPVDMACGRDPPYRGGTREGKSLSRSRWLLSLRGG